jgi:hypothetical protein
VRGQAAREILEQCLGGEVRHRLRGILQSCLHRLCDVLRGYSLQNEALRLRLLACRKNEGLRFRDPIRSALPDDVVHHDVAVQGRDPALQIAERGDAWIWEPHRL